MLHVFRHDNGGFEEADLEDYNNSEEAITPQDSIGGSRATPSTDFLSLYNMTAAEALPMAGFPMPDGWKGDSADNPNFKALGKLSQPVMRKIEPSGPAYLAYARRKLKGRTFSEDDRIEALSKVKKIEDNDDGEISEPEDPMMLQRDAKDWKVRSATASRLRVY